MNCLFYVSQILLEYFLSKMSCSQPCTVEEKHLYFSKTRATFQQARTICKNKGGTLATNLDYEVYRKINSCCTSQHDYWIGLKDDPVLCFSSTEPYHWIEEDSCHSGQPLNIRRQPNNIKCQAITVSINSVNQDLPRAYESDCPSQHHYICQLPSSKMLPYTTPKVFGSLTATSAYSDSSTLDNSSLKIWMIAGGIIALAILVLLLIALCCFYHKKKTNKKKKQTIKRNIVSSKVNSTSTLKTSTSTFISNNNNELNRKGSFHLYYRYFDYF